jgi:hypothetical protein
MDTKRHPLWELFDSKALRQYWPILTFLALGGLLLWNLSLVLSRVPTMPFTTFVHHLQAGHIARIDVQGETMTGRFKPQVQNQEQGSSRPSSDFKTHIPAFAGRGLMDEILKQQVILEVHPRSNHSLGYLMLAFLPAALLIIFALLRLKPGQAGSEQDSEADVQGASRSSLEDRKHTWKP